MAPDNERTYNVKIDGRAGLPAAGAGKRPEKGEATPISRLKMALAAGAVAGTLGGWGMIAQNNASAQTTVSAPAAQIAALTPTPEDSATAQLATPSSTSVPQATATVAQATPAVIQAAASVAAQGGTANVATSTPYTQATATHALPTATSWQPPTATTRPSATAKPVVKVVATVAPKPVTTTKSSR